MFKSLALLAATVGPAAAFVSRQASSSSVAMHETKADLEALAVELNPILGFYDPLNLAEGEFWDNTNEATIGFLRQAEIKHGRVAMAAFVGYWIQSNYVFTWPQSMAGTMPPSVDLQPEEQWDLVNINAKWQILSVIGFLEIFDEVGGWGENQMPHYMRGRQPGKYPSFAEFRKEVHWVPDLYDPFGFNKKMSDEKRERRLLVEIVSTTFCIYIVNPSDQQQKRTHLTSSLLFSLENNRTTDDWPCLVSSDSWSLTRSPEPSQHLMESPSHMAVRS